MNASESSQITDASKARLLARVTAATATTADAVAAAEQEYRRALAKARRPRATAIAHALNVGVPRAEVAAAAGVKLSRMYQIINDSKRT